MIIATLTDSRESVNIGDGVTDSRGNTYRVTDFKAPIGASSGRVYVVDYDARDDETWFPVGYYPSVFGIELTVQDEPAPVVTLVAQSELTSETIEYALVDAGNDAVHSALASLRRVSFDGSDEVIDALYKVSATLHKVYMTRFERD